MPLSASELRALPDACVGPSILKDYLMPMPLRLYLGAITASLVLAACAQNKPSPQNRSTITPATERASSVPSPSATPSTRTQKRSGAGDTTSANPTGGSATLPERTGIAACDDYLSSYLACHRAAEIYAPGQLQSRYEEMRASLLRDSKDAAIRPQLASRCNSLATQLREALHGKACATDPAPASSVR